MTQLMKVKVGNYIYTVNEADDIIKEVPKKERKDYQKGLEGFCRHSDQTIWINGGMTQAAKQDTVLHELMHAVYWVTGFWTLESFEEENLVSILTPTLLGVMRDNPELMEYLTK